MMLQYAARRMLPTRRMQMMLAQQARISSGTDQPLAAFLFEPQAPKKQASVGEVMAGIGGVGVKRRKRRKAA